MENVTPANQEKSVELLSKILIELEKTNTRLEYLENQEKERNQEKQIEQEKERLRIDSGELSNDEKNLLELQNLTTAVNALKNPSETDEKLVSYLESIQKALDKNQEERVSEKNLNKLVTVIQKDYQNIEMTSRVVNSYGLLFIPVAIVLYILYSLLKDFI